MDLIFLAFANRSDNPLPNLQKEDDLVYRMLDQRARKHHFRIHRDSFVTQDKLIDFLIKNRNELVVFHYSGHAGADVLLLEDDKANAQGIAALLDQCPKLKLVILNGCATAGQVKRLHQLQSKPVVIATSAPVGDETATTFSINFYRAFSDQFATLEQAFNLGIGAAQTIVDTDLSPKKDVGFIGEVEESEASWGLFSTSNYDLEWKLPVAVAPAYIEDFDPNTILIEGLLESLSPYDERVAEIYENEEEDLVAQKEAILKCLPYPVSEQLRKLIVLRSPESKEEQVFYDQLGFDRLKQLVETYNTTIELLAYIHLAQIWDILEQNQTGNIKIEAEEKFRSFFKMKPEESMNYSYFELNGLLGKILTNTNRDSYMQEFDGVKEEFNQESTFQNACHFMEGLKKQINQLGDGKMDEVESIPVCIKAEEQLTIILQKLSFIANYTLESVKDIGVQYFRHSKTPSYKHKIVKIIQRFLDFSETRRELDEYMRTASVYLIKKKDTSKAPLNLSPFIIDENAFNSKARLAKLLYFKAYEPQVDSFVFKHSYRPKDRLLTVRPPYKKDKAPFKAIADQFEAFSILAFNQPLKSL